MVEWDLTLNLLTTTIVAPPRNASKWQMGFNSAFKGLKVIFCITTSPKFDFGEVEKSMFQVVARHWKLIFFLLTNPKCDLREVDKAMFQGTHATLNSYTAS